MKFAPLILLGGLLFAGTALAAEPQQAATGTSLKIGIDPVTGKRRVLTSEESAALDAQAAQPQAKAKGVAAKTAAPFNFPATVEESMANKRVVKGVVGFKPIASSMSSVTVTRNADGTVVFSENGEPIQPAKAKEMASE